MFKRIFKTPGICFSSAMIGEVDAFYKYKIYILARKYRWSLLLTVLILSHAISSWLFKALDWFTVAWKLTLIGQADAGEVWSVCKHLCEAVQGRILYTRACYVLVFVLVHACRQYCTHKLQQISCCLWTADSTPLQSLTRAAIWPCQDINGIDN